MSQEISVNPIDVKTLKKRANNFLKKNQERLAKLSEKAIDIQEQILDGQIKNPSVPIIEGEPFDMFKAPYQRPTVNLMAQVAKEVVRQSLPPPSRELLIKGFVGVGVTEWSEQELVQAIMNRVKRAKQQAIETTAEVVEDE